jgi:putative ABC transport system permease protein
MRAMQSLFRRVRSLFAKDASNAELSEELHFHLQQAIEEKIASGMAPEEARAAAKEIFGSVTQATEECYQARGVAWIDDLLQDVRYGLRTLAKHRSFTTITVLTLALGIGACTAIFSLVNAVLLRSLPYGDSQGLVYLFTPSARLDLPWDVIGPSNADFFDLKKQSRAFSEMTLFEQAIYNLSVGNEIQRIGAARVDADFFKTLEVTPMFGRSIDAGDLKPGKDRVAIISGSLWQSLFGGASDVLGKAVQLDGASYRVVGVLPSDFNYPHKSDLARGSGHIDRTELWIPLSLTPQQKGQRGGSYGYALARLKPGSTIREAQAEMSTIMSRLNALHSVDDRGWGAFVKSFRDTALGPVRPLMWLLLGAVGLVLLIACGNAANLLLARSASRTHELGVRATLGARRGRLLRQMLAESLLLSVAAGCAGVALAWLFLHVLLRLNPGDIPRMADASLDYRVLGFLAGATMLTTLLFGVLPSFTTTRINLAEFLKSAGMRGIVGDGTRVRKGLAIAQIAVVVVLLTGAALLLRSYAKVLAVPTGFSPSTIAVNLQFSPHFIEVSTNPLYNTAQKRRLFFADVLDRLQHIHGVQAAGIVDSLPLSHSEYLAPIEAQGYPNGKNQLVERRRVSPDYFSAMQIPLIEGQGFTDWDAPGHPVAVVVNEALARKYIGAVDAVGHHIRISPQDPWMTITGVMADVRNMSPETAAAPQMYNSFWQSDTDDAPVNGAYIAVRSLLPEDAMVKEIRAVIRSRDPNLAIADVHTMSDLESEATARRRFQTTLLTVFAVIATVLALIGVYGLLAFSVRQRTGEIGIRMALGSTRTGVINLVLREGLAMLGAGLVIGLAASLGISRLVSGFLFGVPAIDPLTYALVPFVLLVGTLAACLVPSVRAVGIDPIDALRHE